MTLHGKTFKAIVAVALFGVTASLPFTSGIKAQNNATSTQPNATPATPLNPDSCSAAFATVMAQYMKPEIEKRFPGDSTAITQFVEGVRHAFEITKATSPYYFGVRNGFGIIDRLDQMREMGFPITADSFCNQLLHALNGSAMGFNPTSADNYLRDAMARMYPEQQAEALSAESQNAFLAQQKAREGVQETASGLLFEVLTEGEGASPAKTDTVRVTYTGRLADGTIFDQTERPIQFPVNRLVPGFTEGLMMMKNGGEYRIFIPPTLGYGNDGAAGVIPPGAALDFTVRLLDILPAKNNQ